MSQAFQSGDFLIYQLESGFALLRVLEIDQSECGVVWHLAAYSDFFPDVESAESAIEKGASIRVLETHMALTQRAFDGTQVAKIGGKELREEELVPLKIWRQSESREVFDRSVRLVLGLR